MNSDSNTPSSLRLCRLYLAETNSQQLPVLSHCLYPPTGSPNQVSCQKTSRLMCDVANCLGTLQLPLIAAHDALERD